VPLAAAGIAAAFQCLMHGARWPAPIRQEVALGIATRCARHLSIDEPKPSPEVSKNRELGGFEINKGILVLSSMPDIRP